MSKLSIIIWIIAAPVFMGSLVVTVLVLPNFADQHEIYIPAAAAVGAIIAMPFSYVIASKIKSLTSGE